MSRYPLANYEVPSTDKIRDYGRFDAAARMLMGMSTVGDRQFVGPLQSLIQYGVRLPVQNIPDGYDYLDPDTPMRATGVSRSYMESLARQFKPLIDQMVDKAQYNLRRGNTSQPYAEIAARLGRIGADRGPTLVNQNALMMALLEEPEFRKQFPKASPVVLRAIASLASRARLAQRTGTDPTVVVPGVNSLDSGNPSRTFGRSDLSTFRGDLDVGPYMELMDELDRTFPGGEATPESRVVREMVSKHPLVGQALLKEVRDSIKNGRILSVGGGADAASSGILDAALSAGQLHTRLLEGGKPAYDSLGNVVPSARPFLMRIAELLGKDPDQIDTYDVDSMARRDAIAGILDASSLEGAIPDVGGRESPGGFRTFQEGLELVPQTDRPLAEAPFAGEGAPEASFQKARRLPPWVVPNPGPYREGQSRSPNTPRAVPRPNSGFASQLVQAIGDQEAPLEDPGNMARFPTRGFDLPPVPGRKKGRRGEVSTDPSRYEPREGGAGLTDNLIDRMRGEAGSETPSSTGIARAAGSLRDVARRNSVASALDSMNSIVYLIDQAANRPNSNQGVLDNTYKEMARLADKIEQKKGVTQGHFREFHRIVGNPEFLESLGMEGETRSIVEKSYVDMLNAHRVRETGRGRTSTSIELLPSIREEEGNKARRAANRRGDRFEGRTQRDLNYRERVGPGLRSLMKELGIVPPQRVEDGIGTTNAERAAALDSRMRQRTESGRNMLWFDRRSERPIEPADLQVLQELHNRAHAAGLVGGRILDVEQEIQRDQETNTNPRMMGGDRDLQSLNPRLFERFFGVSLEGMSEGLSGNFSDKRRRTDSDRRKVAVLRKELARIRRGNQSALSEGGSDRNLVVGREAVEARRTGNQTDPESGLVDRREGRPPVTPEAVSREQLSQVVDRLVRKADADGYIRLTESDMRMPDSMLRRVVNEFSRSANDETRGRRYYTLVSPEGRILSGLRRNQEVVERGSGRSATEATDDSRRMSGGLNNPQDVLNALADVLGQDQTLSYVDLEQSAPELLRQVRLRGAQVDSPEALLSIIRERMGVSQPTGGGLGGGFHSLVGALHNLAGRRGRFR